MRTDGNRHLASRKGSHKPERMALLVVGMHRSGTSALTRVLSLAGASLPKRLYNETIGNPTGHWEPARMIEINDEMLAALGLTTK